MSEVDRLSNSGLYPALPIADKRSRKDGGAGQPPAAPRSGNPVPKTPEAEDPNQPRPPKSLIDDYA
jgi:hypothetical protein